MKRGIYIVVNDRMANQLIALLNSFKEHWPSHYTICVIRYDVHCEKIENIVRDYDNVVMFDDDIYLSQLDKFFGDLWMRLPHAVEAWKSKNKQIPFRIGMHRRFVGLLDPGLFDQFIYLDADIYINRSLDEVFDMLEHFDVVAHDYQFTGPQHVFNMSSPKVAQIVNGNLEDQIQCAGFLASKKGLFSEEQWKSLNKLLEEDGEMLYPWGPDQSLWNYMINKFQVNFINLVRYWPEDQVTHDSQTYTKFSFVNGKLYEGDKEILYFHHIGVPAEEFNRICEGREPKHEFRYRDVFEHYRFTD